MALSPYKVFSPGEILTAADLNASFSHITTNGESLGWPATVSKDLDGQALIIDSGGTSKLQAGTNNKLTLTLNAVALFVWDGSTASVVNGITWTATTTGNGPTMKATGSDTNIDLILQGKGTGKVRLVDEDSQSLDVSKNATNEVLLQAGGTGTDIGLVLKGKGAGTVQLGDAEVSFPDSDGLAGDVYKTDGSGVGSFGAAVPVGTILPYAVSTTPPTGFLLCDGSNVSRTTYSRLDALLSAASYPWGSGDGSTTFTVPDMRRRVPMGAGGSGTGTISNTVGSTGGAETSDVSHTHTVNITTGGVSSDTTVSVTTPGSVIPLDHHHNVAGNTGTSGSTTQTLVQPSAIVAYIIKF